MKTLNLFLKMHFTSLSPDGQPISLAIVTSDYYNTNNSGIEGAVGDIGSKSFYSEFTDYDINRCDDWVKENVISKFLGYEGHNELGKTDSIITRIKQWLSQFSDYKLNFIVDCGWFTWYKFVELMGEWETNKPIGVLLIPENKLPKGGVEEVMKEWSKYAPLYYVSGDGSPIYNPVKIGLPKLPPNFPPVPIDLNDLIMERKGFKSVADAFNVDREILAYGEPLHFVNDNVRFSGEPVRKYNALWDAKVTKAIYEKLK